MGPPLVTCESTQRTSVESKRKTHSAAPIASGISQLPLSYRMCWRRIVNSPDIAT